MLRSLSHAPLLLVLSCSTTPPDHRSLEATLGAAERDEAAIAQIVARGKEVVPDLLQILRTHDAQLAKHALPFRGPSTTLDVRVPLAKVRSLEVLRRMEAAAGAATPTLVAMLDDAPFSYLGNVVDTLCYVGPTPCGRHAAARGLKHTSLRDIVDSSSRSAPIPAVGFVQVFEGRERIAPIPALVERRFAMRRMSMSDPRRGWQGKIDHADLAVAEFASDLLRWEHAEPSKIGAVLAKLAAFYPSDKSPESTMRRDLAHKHNPRFLDSLARTAIARAPDECVLAHVHLMQSGPVARRHAALRAIHALGARGAAAVPWLLSVAKYEEHESLYPWAYWILGELGQHAASTLPDLRRVVSGRDRIRAAYARAAIEKIED